MTEQAQLDPKEVKLSRAQKAENILFAMGTVGNLVTGAFWLVGVWRRQYAHGQAHGRPGAFIPKWPHTISLFCGVPPGAVLSSLAAYGIKTHVASMQWVVEQNTIGLMVNVWTPDGQWLRADSILYHAQDGFTVMSMPGELRAYDFQPYAHQPAKRQAQPPKRKAAKLGKTYKG